MIGIVGLSWWDNPGSVLASYALEKAISNMGIDDVTIIDFASDQVTKRRLIPYIALRIKGKLTQGNEKEVSDKHSFCVSKYEVAFRKRHDSFESFRRENLVLTERFESLDHKILKEKYKACVVTIDTWRPKYINNGVEKFYFLNFLKSGKKIAYGISLATNDNLILDPLKNRYRRLIKRFDAIFPREESGLHFLSQLNRLPMQKVLDPVFLLREDDYIGLLNTCEQEMIIKDENRYVYFYVMSPTRKSIDFAKKVAQTGKCKIIFDVRDRKNLFLIDEFGSAGIESIDISPSDFLRYIMHAECVITDSLHGSIFSIIFHKNFYTFERIVAGENLSTRMKEFMAMLGLERHFNPEDYLSETLDYCYIDEIIEVERQKSYHLLYEILKKI